MGDEDIYLEATKEAEGENRDPALWAKAMTLCNGDEGKAKYEYIRYRVEQLLAKDEPSGIDKQDLSIERTEKQTKSPNITGNQSKKADVSAMKTFKIYQHPVEGYEVIKEGFSWPGFFFTWIWAFVKKLWVIGVILLVAVFVANGVGFVLAGEGGIATLIGFLVTLIPMIITGMKGNEWREESMLPRGYKFECNVIAASSDGALAEAMLPEQERNQNIQVAENNQTNEARKSTASSKGYVVILIMLTIGVIFIAMVNTGTDKDEKHVPHKAKALALLEQRAIKNAAKQLDTEGNSQGKSIYDRNCFACHSTGATGAPKLGDTAAWAPRIAAGMEAMMNKATNGYNAMPPKGACMSCTESDLKQAILFIISKSQ